MMIFKMALTKYHSILNLGQGGVLSMKLISSILLMLFLWESQNLNCSVKYSG